MWTYEFNAPDAQVNIVMGNLFGANDGGDRNPIWQAITLEDTTIIIPEPATAALLAFGSMLLFRRRGNPGSA